MLKNKLEVISLHIPKTGGTSLRNTFKEIYGEANALRFDVKKNSIYLENILFENDFLDDHIKVIHGHFTFDAIEGIIDNFDKIFKVVWLRDPVERVLSNYFYLRKQLLASFTENYDNVQMLNRMLRSVEEFVEIEENINRMSKFISIAELKKVSFIGFSESYSDDLKKLSKLLKWQNYNEFFHNSTGNKAKVDQNVIERIKFLNHDDVALYEEAKKIRKNNII